MLEVAILAILAIPAVAAITVVGYRLLLRDMLLFLEHTESVGGQPLSLIKAQMEDQREAAKEAREEQREMLEEVKRRQRQAMGG